MFYEVNKSTGEVEIIESSVLMVDEFKELVTYFKHKLFPKLGFYYFKIIILMHAPRSPYNRSYFTEEQKLEKVKRSITRAMLKESNRNEKAPEIDLKILKTPVFTAAVKEFMELEVDPVYEEFKVVEEKMLEYNKQLKATKITMKNIDDYKKLMTLGEVFRKQLSEIKKTLFESAKTKEQQRKGGGITTSTLMKAI